MLRENVKLSETRKIVIIVWHFKILPLLKEKFYFNRGRNLIYRKYSESLLFFIFFRMGKGLVFTVNNDLTLSFNGNRCVKKKKYSNLRVLFYIYTCMECTVPAALFFCSQPRGSRTDTHKTTSPDLFLFFEYWFCVGWMHLWCPCRMSDSQVSRNRRYRSSSWNVSSLSKEEEH